MRLWKPGRSLITVAAVVVALLALWCGAIGSAQAATSISKSAPGGYQVLTNGQKMRLDLHIMEQMVPFAEKFWAASDIPDADTGQFLAAGPGSDQYRGMGNIDFTYATLLTALPDQQSFGGVSRSVMLDHLIESIRYEALTNVFSGAGYNKWGQGDTFEFSLDTYTWADAAYMIWDQLDASTQALVEKVVTGEANMLVSTPAVDATPGNTGGETDAWDSPTPAIAAVMFPSDPNQSAWEQTAIRFALNSSSIPGDKTASETVDGSPLSQWITTTNLNADLTLENHGYFNTDYQMVTDLLIGDGAIFYGQAGMPLPQAFSFRALELWNKILGPLFADDGDLLAPGGQDWASKDFEWVDYLGVMATRFQVPVASVLESRALQLTARRQAGTGNGSILGINTSLAYDAALVQRIASDWWNHKLFGPSPVPARASYDAAQAALSDGVRTFPDEEVIGGQFANATATVSWKADSPMATWTPRSHDDLSDPVITDDEPGSLFDTARGTATGAYSCACAQHEFATADTVGGRDLAMAAFSDGTTLLLDRGSGPTFTYGIDQIPGLTGPRPVYTAGGTGSGASLSGTWVDVADRMGMAVAGGAGISATVQPTDAYDTDNQMLQLTGSTGTGSGNRGAALFAGVSHKTMAALAQHVQQPTVPDGWSALQVQAPDGSDRLAVARWSGDPSTSLSINDQRGAPVPAQQATLSDDTATFSSSLAAPAAEQETLRYFVQADGALLGSRDGVGAVLANPETKAVRVKVTYAAPDGRQQTVSRTLASGQQITASSLHGRLVLVGAEYPQLVAARTVITSFLNTVNGWQQQRAISPADAAQLRNAARSTVRRVSAAIEQAVAARPGSRAEGRAIESAVADVSAVESSSGMPPDIASAISAAHDQTLAALNQAEQELTLTIVIQPPGPVFPGESFSVTALVFNRSQGALTGGEFDQQAPPGWQAGQTAAFGEIRAGRTAVVTLNGTVDPAAQPGTTAALQEDLTYQSRGNAGQAQTSVTLTVEPAVTPALSRASVPIPRGQSASVTLQLKSNVSHAVSVDYQLTPPAGVTIAPAQGSISVAAGGTSTTNLVVSAEQGAVPGDVDVSLSINDQGITYQLTPPALSVQPPADGYVANQSANTLTPLYESALPIGGSSLVLGAPLSVHSSPGGVAISPDGSHVYVTNHGSNSVDVIDTSTNTVTSTIPVGTGPYGVVVSPDGKTVYVADNGSNSVDVINTATNAVTSTIPVDAGPYGLAITPDGKTVYVSSLSANTVTPIDTGTGTAGAAIPVGAEPRQISITADGETAYVDNLNSNSVTPIDIATNTTAAAIALPCTGPDANAIDPSNSTLYVTCLRSGVVVPVNTATNQPGTPIHVSSSPQGIAVDASRATVYATDAATGHITPIDTATNTPETSVSVPGAFGIAFGPAG